jgi:hypothetical protein
MGLALADAFDFRRVQGIDLGQKNGGAGLL